MVFEEKKIIIKKKKWEDIVGYFYLYLVNISIFYELENNGYCCQGIGLRRGF